MKEIVIKKIQDFLKDYQTGQNIAIRWGVPVFGFASADDAMFDQLRSVASPTHAVPKDFLESAETAIAFFISFPKLLARIADACTGVVDEDICDGFSSRSRTDTPIEVGTVGIGFVA